MDSRVRHWSLVWFPAAAAAAVTMVAGCSAETSDSATPSGARSSAASARTPHTSDEPRAAERDSCLARQRAAVEQLWYPVNVAIDQVTKSPVGVSASASGKLARLTARTHGRVTRACGTAPTAMAELRRRADRLARAPLERNQLPSLVAAYRTWTDEVGGGAHARLLERKLELCDRVLGKVTVSYVVRSAPAAYGKDMWVDLVFDNATPKPMSATLSGVLEATGVYPAYAGTSFDKQTQAWRYDWGGSSADAVLAPPGRSTTRVGVVLGYLPMRSTGAIFNVQPEVMLVAPTRGSPWCSVPVAEG